MAAVRELRSRSVPMPTMENQGMHRVAAERSRLKLQARRRKKVSVVDSQLRPFIEENEAWAAQRTLLNFDAILPEELRPKTFVPDTEDQAALDESDTEDEGEADEAEPSNRLSLKDSEEPFQSKIEQEARLLSLKQLCEFIAFNAEFVQKSLVELGIRPTCALNSVASIADLSSQGLDLVEVLPELMVNLPRQNLPEQGRDEDPHWLHSPLRPETQQGPDIGDTQPPEELSSSSEDKGEDPGESDREESSERMDDSDEVVEVAPEAVLRAGQSSKSLRQLIPKAQVVKLVAWYKRIYGAYVIAKKGKPGTQLIPAKVWQEVAMNYRKAFPGSSFRDDSLKDHLRVHLRGLDKLDHQDKLPEGQDPEQDEELMTRLMSTDSWKARNVLQERMGCAQGLADAMKGKEKLNSTSSTPATSGSVVNGHMKSAAALVRPATPSNSQGNQKLGKPATKSQNLKEARMDMGLILTEFKAMNDDKRTELVRKRTFAEGKAAFFEAKRHESEERTKTLNEQRIALEETRRVSRMTLLEKQKDLGLIIDAQYKEKLQELFQI